MGHDRVSAGALRDHADLLVPEPQVPRPDALPRGHAHLPGRDDHERGRPALRAPDRRTHPAGHRDGHRAAADVQHRAATGSPRTDGNHDGSRHAHHRHRPGRGALARWFPHRRARVAFDFPGARSLPGHRPGARDPDDSPGPGDQAGFLRPRPVPAHGGRVRRPHLRHQRRLHQRMDQPGGARAVRPVRGAHCRFRLALPALRRSPAARADLHRPHLRVEHRLRGAHSGHRAGAGIPDPVLRPSRQVDGLLRRGLSTAVRVHHRRAPHPVRRRDPGPLRSHAAHPHRLRHRGGALRALRRPRCSRLRCSAGVDLRALPNLPGDVRLELHDQRPAFPSR